MALINIEYGSLASSDTMNKNFSYLDDKIAELSSSTTTLISSILSNIATINSRLGDLADDIQENSEKCASNLSKTRQLVNKVSILPNWGLCYELSQGEMASKIVNRNGFLLLYPNTTAKGNLTVNGNTIPLKARSVADDNAAQMFFIPVKAGDNVACTVSLNKAFFLPAVEFLEEDI